MSFVPPVWESANSHYVIQVLPAQSESARMPMTKDTTGNTVFNDLDSLENVTDSLIHNLIKEGSEGNWFSKLPTHEQLMKRVRHTFGSLADNSNNSALLSNILLTPKQLTFVWKPETYNKADAPKIEFDDSSSDDSVDLKESDLPPVTLTDDAQETQEEYLLTRLRAAKARVEAEQIRMQYFEATGKMPPDSDSEDE
jgi:hypothetical protein